MVRTTSLVLGLVGVAVGSAAWTAYQNRTTPRVPYDVVDRLDGVEIRRYPRTAAVETVAPTERAAFGRLFRYVSGSNRAATEMPMTAPVETDDLRAPGEKIPMTAPVETDTPGQATGGNGRGDVRMAFYLPEEYDAATAPEPTDPAVRLVEVPRRTLAVRRFTWRATDRRVARETDRLVSTLEAEAGATPTAAPIVFQYDAPWTLPFLRRNEVAVELDVD